MLLCTAIAIGVLRWPLLLVLIVLLSTSVGLCWSLRR
jgi:hypothetical protein